MWLKKKQKLRATSFASAGKSYHQEAIGVLMSALVMFLVIAIVSYNPADNSAFSFSSETSVITNWSGAVGASIASWSLHLFGSAVYLLLICLMVWAYRCLLARQHEGTKRWLLLTPVLISSGAALCAMYQFDITRSFAGGLVGQALTSVSFNWFGVIGSALIFWSLLWVSMMMIVQFSITQLVMTVASYCYARGVLLTGWVHTGVMNAVHGLVTLVTPASSIKVVEKMEITAASTDADFWKNLDKAPEQEATEQEVYDVEEVAVQSAPAVVNDAWLKVVARSEKRVVHKVGSLTRVAPSVGWLSTYFREKPFLKTSNSLFSKNMFATADGALVSPFVAIMQAVAQQGPAQPVGKTKLSWKDFKLPSLSLFTRKQDNKQQTKVYEEALLCGKKLEEKLHHFGVKGRVVAVKPGPLVTLFEYEPEIDSKISKITSLEDDLAMALAAVSIRIIAPIPGKNLVGFEIANKSREDVLFSTVIASAAFQDNKANLPFVLGVDLLGTPVVEDLIRMPHLLVGGATGSGKSVGLNGMLASLLCANRPDQLKLILIDPKRLEFTPYADIPHLLFPIVTNPTLATSVLKWVVHEMERRYETMAGVGVRSMLDYQKLAQESNGVHEEMPFIVVIIDELADLMIVAGKEVEIQIVRIAQMARAAGIHMIVATQRPSVDVVTGLIKVNFPSRVAFRVSSKVDSRTILDQSGAEKLLGRGDLLFMHTSSSHLTRIHGAYISDQEIAKLVDHIRSQGKASYLDMKEIAAISTQQKKDEVEDDLYPEVINFIKTAGEISISMLQRQYRIGFNRSARIIEQLELDGFIAPSQGSKPRKVLR